MSTSLQQQLQRLKTPQTSILYDSKTRASILFDPTDAATKDSETIYDIGYSGLQELIALNQSFTQFELTLFDKNARELQRAVESSEVNRQLNETIKKFLVHLSPYFLLSPTHKCLEWLIRRFNINDYNKDEFMLLILPYHETIVFVKCLQTMPLDNTDDKWHWLNSIKKNGVPLAKQTLLNRAATDNYFHKFVCESTVYASQQLDTKANTLQAFYAFYGTTVIGALELSTVTESQVTNIYAAIRKGLKSTSIDFCAASLMIVGQLVCKTKLTTRYLETTMKKIIDIQHPFLQTDAIMLLVIIHKMQSDMLKELPARCLRSLVDHKWIPSVLSKIYGDDIDILPFCLSLLSACLKNVQLQGEEWKQCKKFVNNLFQECFFKENDAEKVIRCVLNAYMAREKSEDPVITIESENESENEGEARSAANQDITGWYTNLLKSLERQYSSIFDHIIKEILLSKNSSVSESKKKSLKTVLGFLFSIVCTEDNVNIFEKLYHHNAQYRIEGVKFLVKNLEKMCFSDDSKDLLKDSIAERISDDSSSVVHEALRFSTQNLLKIVGREQLEMKLIAVLENTMSNPGVWGGAGLSAIKHLMSIHICNESNATVIFISVLPFLLQPNDLGLSFIKVIVNSTLGRYIPFVHECQQAISNNDDEDKVADIIFNIFEAKVGFPNTAEILKYIHSIADKDLTVSKAFYTMLLLGYSIRRFCTPEISLEILNVITRFSSNVKSGVDFDNSAWMANARNGVYSINLSVACIQNIIDGAFTELSLNELNFVETTSITLLLHKIFEQLISGLWTKRPKVNKRAKHELYTGGLSYFFENLTPTLEDKIEFLSNYCIVDVTQKISMTSTANAIVYEEKLQVFTLKHFRIILKQSEQKHNSDMSIRALIRILAGLRSIIPEIREATFELLPELVKLRPSPSTSLIKSLLERKEEILMDENQLPLILYTIFQRQTKDIKALNNDFIAFIADENNDSLLTAILLQSLQHVDDANILEQISKAALNIINDASTELSATGTKIIVLDPIKSTIVQSILSRFTQKTVKILKKHEVTWHMLLKSVENHNIFLNLNNSNTKSVTTVILEIIAADLFNDLLAEHQKQLIKAAVSSATFSEDVDVTIATTKFFKKININAKLCVDLLDDMANVRINETTPGVDNEDDPMTGVTKTTSKRRRNASTSFSSDLSQSSPELLKTKQWKRGITWLERLQNIHKMTNTHFLIAPLFAILTKCLQFEDQSNVEYVKQLILSCILHCCQTLLSTGNVKHDVLSENVYKVEAIVKCIRGTQNPQTHHHAMQLLACTTQFLPDQVLHNMTDIFTFVGSSIVRHDDAYSFQIINNIIASIIPSLTKLNEKQSEKERYALVVPVLKVFSDIILDVPEHRRIPLYVKLLETLGVNDYLWIFLTVLFESHVRHHKSSDQTGSELGLRRRIEIALALSKEFSCETVLIASTELLIFLQKLPTYKPTGADEKLPAEIITLFNVQMYTAHQFRNFKYTIAHFINNLTSSPEFVNKIAELSDEETKQLKPYYQKAIIAILSYIPILSKATETTEQSHIQYWKIMLHICYDILDNIISLVPPISFVRIVEGLLSHTVPGVRRKITELLIKKLQTDSFFTEIDDVHLLGLIDPLQNIIESILDEQKLMHTASSNENVAIQQTSLIAVKLLSKYLAENNPSTFKEIIEILIQIIRSNEDVPRIVLASVVLCLAEICSNIRAESIAFLSRFMPMLNIILTKQLQSPISANDPFLISIIIATQKIVEILVLFLSPYLVDLVVLLAQIWDRAREQMQHDSKVAALISRLNSIWEKFATTLSLRVLLPTVERSYEELTTDGNYRGIGPLMQLLTQTLKHLPSSEIANFMSEISSLTLNVLKFRADNGKLDVAVVNTVENDIIQAFNALTLKLSEGNFRPLYCKIYDWALRNDENVIDRAITFFRLSSEIASSLKSLFVLFASDFIPNAADLLSKLNTCNDEEAQVTKEQSAKSAALIESIIDTLYKTFLYGGTGFVNGTRFDILLQPLVDQIENEIVIHSVTIRALLTRCLAQLATATNDDTLWKQLNYQILMKTRNNSPEIRIFALASCVELARKFGEDYMPLLPETIPFLAELLEDETPEVEKQCQSGVQELEKILGEPLQKYF